MSYARREDGTPWRGAGFRRVAGGGRSAGAGVARARAPGRGTAPPARRDDRRSAPHRVVPYPAAGTRRRQRTTVPLDRRAVRGDRPGLWLDRLGAGQSRRASLALGHVAARGTGRDLGPVAR